MELQIMVISWENNKKQNGSQKVVGLQEDQQLKTKEKHQKIEASGSNTTFSYATSEAENKHVSSKDSRHKLHVYNFKTVGRGKLLVPMPQFCHSCKLI